MSSLGTERTPAQTTDGTAQTFNVGTLAAVGASILFDVVLMGTKTNAQEGLYARWMGQAARNATASGIGLILVAGPTGFTDPAAAPYTAAPAVPAGWAANIALAGTIVQLQYNGAAGDTIDWRIVVLQRFLVNGATL
jgi:hypothetical protein